MKDMIEIKKGAFNRLKAELNNPYTQNRNIRKCKDVARKLANITLDDIEIWPPIEAKMARMVTYKANIYAKTKTSDGNYGDEKMIDEYEFTKIFTTPNPIAKDGLDSFEKEIMEMCFEDSSIFFDSFTKEDLSFLYKYKANISTEYMLSHWDLHSVLERKIRVDVIDCQVKTEEEYKESTGIRPIVAKITGSRRQNLYLLIEVYDEKRDILRGRISFLELSDYFKPILFEKELPENAHLFPDMKFIPTYKFCTWKKGLFGYKLIEP